MATVSLGSTLVTPESTRNAARPPLAHVTLGYPYHVTLGWPQLAHVALGCPCHVTLARLLYVRTLRPVCTVLPRLCMLPCYGGSGKGVRDRKGVQKQDSHMSNHGQ